MPGGSGYGVLLECWSADYEPGLQVLSYALAVCATCIYSSVCYNETSGSDHYVGGIVRRSESRRTRIIFWIISLLVVISMGLSLAVSLVPPGRVTPTPIPTFTPFPTRTPTPAPA